MKLRTLYCNRLLLAAVSLTLAFGQERDTPPPPTPTAPPPGGTPTPGTTTRPGTIPNQNPTYDPTRRDTGFDMPRPIFLSGKVVLDDGTPPSDSVVIERVCNGAIRPEGYTDSKGRFSFQLGQNTSMMADASTGSMNDGFPGSGPSGGGGFGQPGGMGGSRGVTERSLMGCELRASLPGYRSEAVSLSSRRVMDNPDIGTIVLRRLGNVEGLTISATTAMAPKDARKAYEKGRDAAKKGKMDDAQRDFEKAVELYPKYAVAWFDLGRVYEEKKDVEQARKAFQSALAADSKYVSPYEHLALMAVRENKWQDVLDTTDRIARLNPIDFPRAYFYNALANLNLQKLDAAEKSAREALKLDAAHRIPQVNYLLGVILAKKQDYAGAAEHMRAYLAMSPNSNDAPTVRKQLAEVEKSLRPTAENKQPE